MHSCGEHIAVKLNMKTRQMVTYRNVITAPFLYLRFVATIMNTSIVLLKEDAKIEKVTRKFSKSVALAFSIL